MTTLYRVRREKPEGGEEEKGGNCRFRCRGWFGPHLPSPSSLAVLSTPILLLLHLKVRFESAGKGRSKQDGLSMWNQQGGERAVQCTEQSYSSYFVDKQSIAFAAIAVIPLWRVRMFEFPF